MTTPVDFVRFFGVPTIAHLRTTTNAPINQIGSGYLWRPSKRNVSGELIFSVSGSMRDNIIEHLPLNGSITISNIEQLADCHVKGLLALYQDHTPSIQRTFLNSNFIPSASDNGEAS
jgi:hypothetical protein